MNEAATKTEEKPKRRHRSPHGPGKFVTDLELAEIMGIPPDKAKQKFMALDQNPRSNFPKKNHFWEDRRYLPDVEKWLDETAGRKISDPQRRLP